MIRFHIGCGKRNFGLDWFHVDGGLFGHLDSKDIYLKGIPNNYIDLLYNSHLIAYFLPYEATDLLERWYKKIKHGGVLRIATPDFNALSKLYQLGCELDKLKGPLYGYMQMEYNWINHKTVYDEKTLTDLLTETGFINIHRYDHTKTEHPNTGNMEDFYDDHSCAYINGTLISLNIEANKP